MTALLDLLFFVAFALPLIVRCQLVDQDFTPSVTATCKAGQMTIKVQTNSSFIGAIHAKDFRTPACLAYGNGNNSVTLNINLYASPQSPDYCGVLVSNKTEERSLPIAVRIHRTLELADDKFYVITCGKAGFKNAKNETSLVSLKVLDKDKKRRVQEVYYSRPYIIRAEISKPDGTYSIRVKSCFAFNRKNNSVELINDRGCPLNSQVISPFRYDEKTGIADSELYSMFQFPDGNQVHFQCDIGLCKGGCPELNCEDGVPVRDTTEEGVILASTSVFVLQPGEPAALEDLSEPPRWGPPWLLYLCIALGLLFLLMLIVNVFLCSAMTCSCTRNEVIEKEPSVIEEYDPYRSWHGTQYGSRYSLNGKPGGGYISGGSTLNSARSVSTNSDHYAIVDSHRHRSPGPHTLSHYSRKH